jgi:hypothetical protein
MAGGKGVALPGNESRFESILVPHDGSAPSLAAALKALTLAHLPVMVDRPIPAEISRAEESMEQNAIEP